MNPALMRRPAPAGSKGEESMRITFKKDLHYANVTLFMSQAGSMWAGAGRLCFDIPFAGKWGIA